MDIFEQLGNILRPELIVDKDMKRTCFECGSPISQFRLSLSCPECDYKESHDICPFCKRNDKLKECKCCEQCAS